jgi:SpoVK/Ycf46/Vps4 family AAA+-type ATPase
MRFFTTKPLSLLSVLSILSLPTLAMDDGPETHPPLTPRTSARLDAYPALFEEINHYGKNNIQIYRRLNVFFEEHIPNIEEFRTQLELAKTAETLRPSTISYVSNILESIRPIIISDTSRTKQKSSSRFSKMKGLPSTIKSSEPTISEREHPMLFAKTIIDSLNEVIIGEQKAMRELGTYISRNEGVISVNEELLKEGHKRPINKTSILLKGPTGCGKTACIKQLAKILNVPFYIADSSTFTRTGYRGDSASFVIEELLRAGHIQAGSATRSKFSLKT